MLQEHLLMLINNINSNDYYPYGNIPSNKLQTAMQTYPVDPLDTPLALIDTTVMGSAKCGMVIGLKGIYFRNDWTTKTIKNFISWDELSRNTLPIGDGAMSCILLTSGCEFNMSGSSMKKVVLINLLNQIVSLYRSAIINEQQPVLSKDNCKQISSISSISTTSILYTEIVPEILALCIVADGEIEDSEVELAIAIIDNDDLIHDKQIALDSLMTNVEKFGSDRKTSSAIFKLKSTSIISKVSKITEELQKDRLNIMLDSMLETISNNVECMETSNMINTIRIKLR